MVGFKYASYAANLQVVEPWFGLVDAIRKSERESERGRQREREVAHNYKFVFVGE